MAYYRHTEMRAKFAKLGIQAGKAVLTFEVGGEELYNLPTLALLTGEKVRIDIESDQSVLLIGEGTGEILSDESGQEAVDTDEAAAEMVAEAFAKIEAESEAEERNETAAAEPEGDAFDDDLDAIFGAA